VARACGTTDYSIRSRVQKFYPQYQEIVERAEGSNRRKDIGEPR